MASGSERCPPPCFLKAIFAFMVAMACLGGVYGGITSVFVRSEWPSVDIPIENEVFAVPKGYNAPQQVHITQGDYDGRAMIVSWVTPDEPGSRTVRFGKSAKNYGLSAEGTVTNYTFYKYTSGYIHHCLLEGLEHGTKYYYKIGHGESAREFWFTTPPRIDPDASYKFGIIGDLGQTYNSLSTLEHYMKSGASAVLFVGDLSYADRYQYNDVGIRWDTWGRFVERSTAFQPWIWSAGNHEIEYMPHMVIYFVHHLHAHSDETEHRLVNRALLHDFSPSTTQNDSYQKSVSWVLSSFHLINEQGEVIPFKSFLHRYATPHLASESSSPLWYAIKHASAHIIVLSSYSPFVKYTPQWVWLREELQRVDREKTPWLIVLMHIPIYNSNEAHFMEGESMRAVFEKWFIRSRVDVVFAGHVHAYERSYRISNIQYNVSSGNRYPIPDKSAPVYITVGDGGNQEGLAGRFMDPQPEYSAFREASYGHSTLEIMNRTHALYHWNRNDDGKKVATDAFLLHNQYWASNQRRRKLKKNHSLREILSQIATF